ncbi:hypothetical protein Taro_019662 [Colocasia esculenta]|uniref:Uncharacterized protein n=1 Tax=Colocasia esculenta TaxID=4460 RepID=A0A843V2V7_COLES|nr:hypothetical protein [Colocasia esculenta]
MTPPPSIPSPVRLRLFSPFLPLSPTLSRIKKHFMDSATHPLLSAESPIHTSDDDEFYDRTKKKPSLKKSGDQQSVETADTLLDKKDTIMKEMEEKTNLLQEEKAKMVTETKTNSEEGDELDAYMTGLSSQQGLS